eukprot:Mycagemm_TRINITY_DN10322_c6_g4::TRINITY_DN10322_c6_g4_i1::g.583::m.583 type:complete len:129 gc:universal TRINITY_DN10322_c6_g4_i1:839-1225(+)
MCYIDSSSAATCICKCNIYSVSYTVISNFYSIACVCCIHIFKTACHTCTAADACLTHYTIPVLGIEASYTITCAIASSYYGTYTVYAGCKAYNSFTGWVTPDNTGCRDAACDTFHTGTGGRIRIYPMT